MQGNVQSGARTPGTGSDGRRPRAGAVTSLGQPGALDMARDFVTLGTMTRWRKSTYSSHNGQCVEVAGGSTWGKSSHSFSNGNCTEVAACSCGAGILVRDSKDPGGPVLSFGGREWASFTATVKRIDTRTP